PPTRAGGELQPDRPHRLAGPGLAGEDVQAGMQLEVEVVDHAETADVQLAEHPAILDRAAALPGEGELVTDEVVERRRVIAPNEPRRCGGAFDLDRGADRELQAVPAARRGQPRLLAQHREG